MNAVRALVATLTIAIVMIVLAPTFTDDRWWRLIELMTR